MHLGTGIGVVMGVRVGQPTGAFVLQSSDEPDSEPGDESLSLNYTLNTSYDIDSRGFRRSRVGREIVNLQQQAETQAYWEQRLAESTEQEEAAMKIIQEDHEIAVARDTAIAQFRAKEAEMANEFAERMANEEEDQNDVQT
jgi:hypothetical protein